jgi:serine/threonine-protein kinase
MSPEQATGEQLGAPGDIYSLASVVYEMLVGEPPYVGSTAQAVIAKRFSDPAPSARRLRDSIPPPVDSAIKRALAKLPTDRFADAQEFATALAAKHVELDTEDKSVAVLPFENLSPDPEDEYFSDGMTEEIINALTQLEGLRVAARTSSFAFKGKRPDLAEVGSKLSVSTVLEGSVRKAGNRLRITAQLVNVADGYHLWSERYDRQMDDVFAVQDDIARMVADRLRTTLMEPPAEALVTPPTESLEAYHLYLKGHFFWRKRDKWIPKGLELLEKAVALDPGYARAHAGLADCYASLGTYGFLPPEQARPRAKASAARALELDPNVAEAHCAMGYVQWYCEWKLVDAEASFRRAIALRPTLASAHAFLSFLLPLLGRHEEALEAARLASELEPLSAFNRALSAIGHYILRNYEAATQLCDEAMELDPTLYNAPWIAGWAYEQLGRFEEATQIIEKAVALTSREDPVSLGSLGRIYALSGREHDAEAVLKELRERATRQYVPWVSVARIHAGLGQHDLALDALEQVVENWEPGGWWIFFGPEFDQLRSDRRYIALAEKVRALW